MADFIIKPASGDTLKLQDEGGDDAISISTTGVSTIANATITAWTPPADTIIQIIDGGEGSTDENTTSTTFQATDCNATINFNAGNKIFAIGHFSAYIHAGGNDAGALCQLSTNANNDDNDMIGTGANLYAYTAGLNPGPEVKMNQPLNALFSPSGTSVTVTLKYKAQSGGQVNMDLSYCRIYLMEIQA